MSEPERDIYGRRPPIVTPEQEQMIRRAFVLTPSNIDPWFGGWAEGAVFTNQQLRDLYRLGLDPATIDRIDVLVKASNREWYWNPIDPAT